MRKKATYHKIYLTICTILLFIYLILGCVVFSEEYKDFLKYILIILPLPIILCFVAHFIAKITNSTVTKILVNLMYICAILYQIYHILILFVWLIFQSGIDDIEYSNIKDYSKALRLYPQKSVEHFPKIIPDKATDISFKRTAGGMLGDSALFLKFNIDENYIRSEAEKYKNAGKEYIITNDNLNDSNYNYDKERATRTLNALEANNIGYRFRVIESKSCINGFAYKNKNIIYILYCD